jgi:D-beta-D-heptose 7-phosphate kinase/D-beta-D-heptose 1-phosphate adenosyltransferase
MLIVGIDTDRKVRADKGPDRPIYPLEDRKYQLSSLKAVDVIHTFDSRQELEELIKIINPDILVVGSDWKNGDVVGREYAKRVEFFDRIGEYSTTKTIQGHRYR